MSQPFHELLSTAEIETLFVEITTALCVTITLDGIDRLPKGFQIRSHDFFSPLPNIEIESTSNTEQVLDQISLSVARLGATVRARRELATRVHDCKFIIPTSTCKVTVVGICTEGRTIQARGGNTYQAYQKLNRKIVELSLHAA